LKHNKVLHERIVFLTVVDEEVPHVPTTNVFTCGSSSAAVYQAADALRLSWRADVREA